MMSSSQMLRAARSFSALAADFFFAATLSFFDRGEGGGGVAAITVAVDAAGTGAGALLLLSGAGAGGGGVASIAVVIDAQSPVLWSHTLTAWSEEPSRDIPVQSVQSVGIF